MPPTGQVVAITGASAGIGAAVGRLLVARRDRVVLAVRREEARVAKEIAAAGGEASICSRQRIRWPKQTRRLGTR